MQHNEPGREPTEPTDAELLIDFARKQDRGTINDWVYARAACATRGYEYLSGHRPMPGSEVSRAEVLRMSTETLLKAEAERMPDTPAPDEVAQPTCEWHQSDPTFGGEWATDCGTAFVFEMDEPLTEHGYNFCPKCGKGMVPFPFVYPDEEEDEDAE